MARPGLAEITANIAAPEHVGHFFDKTLPKIVKNGPGWHVQILGVAIFPGKKPPEATLPRSTRVFCTQPTGQNVVLGLIRPLTAPIGARTGASGAELRGGADYGVGLAPGAPKWAEKIGDGCARPKAERRRPKAEGLKAPRASARRRPQADL